MRKIVLVLAVLLAYVGYAQHEFLPLSNDYQTKFNSFLFQKSTNFHSSVRNYRKSEIDAIVNLDSLNQLDYYTSKFAQTWFGGAVFNKHFIEVKTKDFDLSIDPLVNFRLGKEQGGSADYTYTNTRGFYVQGRIGRDVTFMTALAENQSRFADYINRQIDQTKVVPGQGLARDFKETGYDYSNAYGVVSYTPSKFFNFSLGQGKNFFGEGYRTTFLGDGAFNYPFFRIETTVWKIKYVNLWTQNQDIRKDYEVNEQFRKKWTSMHYLSYNVNTRLNISVFEAVVYGSDTLNRGLEASYFNPIILYRPIEFSNSSDHGNVILGMGSSYKLFNDFQLYAQFTLDEFVKAEIFTEPGSWRNKYAVQLGFKYFNAFKVNRLNILAELNVVRPYMYSHKNVLTNYGHYGEALAHPWGGNFTEAILRVDYTHKRWTALMHVSLGVIGNDGDSTNYGKDIYKPYTTRESDDNNKIAQGIKTTLAYADFRLGYLVNPSYNMRVEVGATVRSYQPETETVTIKKDNMVWMYFGLRTALFNNYYDF